MRVFDNKGIIRRIHAEYTGNKRNREQSKRHSRQAAHGSIGFGREERIVCLSQVVENLLANFHGVPHAVVFTGDHAEEIVKSLTKHLDARCLK